MSTIEANCFAFYSQTAECSTCIIMKRCKATAISHGFNIVGDFLGNLLENLPDQEYVDTDVPGDLAAQLLSPPSSVSITETDDLLALLDEN